MPDIIKRIALSTVNTTATTLYTTPALTTTTIRHLRVINSTASTVTIVMSIGLDAIGTRIIPLGTQVAANGSLDISGAIVLNAAETLQATAGTTAALTVVASGVETT